MQGVEVAQAALAVLDVRLDTVAAFTGAAMALAALGHFGIDEGTLGAADHLVAETLLELAVEPRVAVHQPHVDQRRADRQVLARELHALIDRARRVANLEAQVPQQIEHVFGDALAPRRLFVGKQEQQVDVGAGGQHLAPVAAGRDDRHALGFGRVGGAVDMRNRVVVEQADQLVLEPRKPGGAAAAVAVRLELETGRSARRFHERLQAFDDGRARLGGIAVRFEQRRQGLALLLRIEIGRRREGWFVHWTILDHSLS